VLWYESGHVAAASDEEPNSAVVGSIAYSNIARSRFSRLFVATGRLFAVADDANDLRPELFERAIAEHYWQGGQGTEPYKQNTQPQVSRLIDRI
jgi:hypothetical protein